MNEHDIISFGPVTEGDMTISGKAYPMSGYGWSCSCGAAGFGYDSIDTADYYGDRHCSPPCLMPDALRRYLTDPEYHYAVYYAVQWLCWALPALDNTVQRGTR